MQVCFKCNRVNSTIAHELFLYFVCVNWSWGGPAGLGRSRAWFQSTSNLSTHQPDCIGYRKFYRRKCARVQFMLFRATRHMNGECDKLRSRALRPVTLYIYIYPGYNVLHFRIWARSVRVYVWCFCCCCCLFVKVHCWFCYRALSVVGCTSMVFSALDLMQSWALLDSKCVRACALVDPISNREEKKHTNTCASRLHSSRSHKRTLAHYQHACAHNFCCANQSLRCAAFPFWNMRTRTHTDCMPYGRLVPVCRLKRFPKRFSNANSKWGSLERVFVTLSCCLVNCVHCVCM